jgi:hypothetical protein
MRSDAEEGASNSKEDTGNSADEQDIDTHSAKPAEGADSVAAEELGDSEGGEGVVTDDGTRGLPAAKGRRVSISIRTLVVGAVIVALVVAAGVMTWLYIGVKTTLDERLVQADNDRHAEQLALDYAVNAAIMDYQDLAPWKQELVKGTTPELKDKLTKAATGMEQILLPLQWSSTASPLVAKVRSDNNGVYVVDTFVSVMTKTVQAGDSLQSTATYSITIDSNNEWLISDVGGIATMVGDK